MELSEVFPPSGNVQRLYCDKCQSLLDLAYADFHEVVSGVDITIEGLPVLRCPSCGHDHLPDRSRFAIIQTHESAIAAGKSVAHVKRKKLNETYSFTNVPFIYDADDYHYIPGLIREHNIGFLTPVFFNKRALLKYDTAPGYRLRFSSATYGEIVTDTDAICFGVNRFGHLVMWLGDIATLPENEQFYLRSENIASDHSIGSEFYEGQIECVFTEPSIEQRLFELRSKFLEACYKRFAQNISHLDEEVLELASRFNAPVVDTPAMRETVAIGLNKMHIEAISSDGLGTIVKAQGGNPKDLGRLKRLQLALEGLRTGADVGSMLSPFFVLYDLRVAYSHLTSVDTAKAMLKTVTDRLVLPEGSGLLDIYQQLTAGLTASYEKLIELVEPSGDS